MSGPATKTTISATSDRFPDATFVLTEAVSAGSSLRVRASGNILMSTVEVTSVRAAGIGELEIVHRFTRAEQELQFRWHNRAKPMAEVAVAQDLSAGTELTVSGRWVLYQLRGAREDGEETPQNAVQRYSGLSWFMTLLQIDDLQAEGGPEVAPPFEIAFVPGRPDRIEAYLAADGTARVRSFDAQGDPTAGGPYTVHAGAGSVEVAGGSVSPVAVAVPVDAARPRMRVKASDSADRQAVSNALPVTRAGHHIYFGEFHWHTEFSGDGQRPGHESLASARDELCLDFAGPADHIQSDGTYGATGHTVAEQLEILRQFDEPGRFVAIPAAEHSRRYGHANIYTDSFATLEQVTSRYASELAPKWEKQPYRYDFPSLLDVSPPGKVLIVPHHTNMDSYVREGVLREGLPAWCGMHWPLPANRDRIRLVEMVQTRGCFEAEQRDYDWWIFDGGLSGSVRTALARGYRLGFLGGTDNHSGWPTRRGNRTVGLTAIQADRLELGSLFQAMHARRTYATTGARIVADVTLNGHAMGSELQLEPGVERTMRISIQGTAPLERVEVVHAGFTLASLPVARDSADFEVEWADDRPGRPLEDVYYYVRARQVDGNCLWTSPCWVDLAE